MADENEVILVRIQAQVNDLEKSFKKIEKGAESTGAKLNKTLGAPFLRLAGIAAAAGAAIGGALFGRAAIRGAIEAEDAINGTAQALRSVGQFSDEALSRVVAFADGIEATTTTTKEGALELFNIAQAYFRTSEQAELATRAALDFAAGAGISATEAVRRLGRAAAGSVGDVSRFAPEIANLTKEQLRAGEATRILQGRFEGFAAAQTKTFGGALTQLGNAFGSVQDSVGEIIVQSPFLRDAILEISKALRGVSGEIEGATKNRDFIAELAIAIASLGQVINLGFILPIQTALRIFRTGLITIQAGIVGLISGVLSVFNAVNNVILKIYGANGEGGIIDRAAKSLARFREQSFLAIGDSVDDTISGVTQNKLNEALERIKNFASQSRDAVGSSIDGIKKPLNEASEEVKTFADGFREGMDSLVPSIDRVGSTIATTIGQGIGNAFTSFGRALATGQNGFKAFGQSVLSTLGSLAIQVGQFFILVGTALSSTKVLFGLSGAGAIAAGIGLTVLGGLLQGIAGATPNPTGAGGGLATGGADANPVTGVPDVSRPDDRSIQVIIEGNVLDRRETGLEIVRVIQENLSEFGGRVTV